MELMRETLLKVESGVNDFAPESDSLDHLRQFQPLAKCLYAAHKDGLIHNAKFRISHMRDTHGWFKAVIISGGLTYKGDQWLSLSSSQPSPTRKWLTENASQLVIAVVTTVVAAAIIALLGIQ